LEAGWTYELRSQLNGLLTSSLRSWLPSHWLAGQLAARLGLKRRQKEVEAIAYRLSAAAGRSGRKTHAVPTLLRTSLRL
jgi:hypothetical protein